MSFFLHQLSMFEPWTSGGSKDGGKNAKIFSINWYLKIGISMPREGYLTFDLRPVDYVFNNLLFNNNVIVRGWNLKQTQVLLTAVFLRLSHDFSFKNSVPSESCTKSA